MANTFQLISSVSVGSGGTSSISFTSIPNTFTDLKILLSGNSNEVRVSFNTVTSNLTDRVLYGIGASTIGSNPNATFIRLSSSPSPANNFSNTEIDILSYASGALKSVPASSSAEDTSDTYAGLYLTAGRWSDTSAIVSVQLTPSSGNFSQFSTAYLYGIKNV